MQNETSQRMLEIEGRSARNLQRLSGEWARAEGARREELFAAMEIERWVVESCRDARS
ncbi:MAG: hypothetical protein AABZ47_18290 [Planctomycetota bacterium]